jgi:hypothetical protein
MHRSDINDFSRSKTLETNRRLVTAFKTGRQFCITACARLLLSAEVARLGGRPFRIAMKPIATLFSVLALGTLLAADWPTGPADKHAYLEVVIANKTGSDIDETGVYFGQHRCTAGIVGSGYSKGYLGWQKPITTNAIVRWRDARSVKKEQTVTLVGVYNPKVNGALTFTIGVTNVSVEFKKIDRDRSAGPRGGGGR